MCWFSESTYDWNAEEWTVPVNFAVSKLTNFGKQPVSLQMGYRHYLDKPSGGPDWGPTVYCHVSVSQVTRSIRA
jgi:hypothetical protein